MDVLLEKLELTTQAIVDDYRAKLEGERGVRS